MEFEAGFASLFRIRKLQPASQYHVTEVSETDDETGEEDREAKGA